MEPLRRGMPEEKGKERVRGERCCGKKGVNTEEEISIKGERGQ